MSNKSTVDQEAAIILERKESKPENKSIVKATILAKNSQGLYLDINKCYEAHVANNELGDRSRDEYQVGDSIEIFVVQEDRNASGVFKASIKQLEEAGKWESLISLQNQDLEVSITKILKSGVEALIPQTKQIAFIPFGYLDNQQEGLRNEKREDWLGTKIPARIHELDQSKNKIILNNKVISEELKAARAKEVLASLELGRVIEGKVVRLTAFGVFVDLGSFDALIPYSELAWRRFKQASEIVQVGQTVQAKVFRIDTDKQKIALSLKQMSADPWTTLEIAPGFSRAVKVVSHAEFGAFVEVLPGIEALLHKSQFINDTAPEIDSTINVTVVNIDAEKRRMGVKFNNDLEPKIEEITDPLLISSLINDTKELEHVNQ